jgi:hypothetical protein
MLHQPDVTASRAAASISLSTTRSDSGTSHVGPGLTRPVYADLSNEPAYLELDVIYGEPSARL